ncbi:MAG: Si-specific NAD(P)(+) transhydrogenase [Deltaproteobacteria bacterium]|nr:Si-specific NAD(P)(+) transhydrogenase [Deltaproteobacteria bacterium]
MAEPNKIYDLVVIGSGPAGYRAAMQAAKMKRSVAIVEATPGRLGGTWIHTGTVPSKALRESMDAIHNISFHAGGKWVERIIRDLPAAKLMGRAHKVSQYEESIVRRYCDRYGVEIIEGFASFADQNSVNVRNEAGETFTVRGRFFLVATGSRPRRPAEVPFDGWRIVDGDEVLRLECVPKSVLIYGAGVIGCEYASIFAALGTETTIIDGRNTIMQYADHEIAAALKKTLEDESGVKFVLGSKMASAKVGGPGVQLTLENGHTLEAEVLFYAAGRVPNTDKLGLDKLGIKLSEKGEIVVNQNFQTSVPNVYAAGDNIGSPALAATSAVQGRYAARHMFGKKSVAYPKVYPIGVYTIPELSSVGRTEQDLKENGVDYVVGRAHCYEVARGYIRGDDHGLLKLLVCAKTHKILGIHILMPDACNLVHIGLIIMQKGGHAQDLVNMVFNYPTLAEAYGIAAFNALNKLFPDGEICDPPESN